MNRAGPSRRFRPRGLTLLAAVAVAATASSAVQVVPALAAGSSGEAAKTAQQILVDARVATTSATSVRVAGSVGQGASATTLNVVAGHSEGGGLIGVGGATFNVIIHATKVYLKADEATWTKEANAAVAGLLANRWLQTTTADKDFANFVQLLEVPSLTKGLLSPSGQVVKGKMTTYNGTPAIPLVDKGKSGGTLYVAATGSPYVLGLVGSASNPGSIRFTQYNTVKVPAAPSGAVNLNQLENGGSTPS
jgi:hypothetical protein